jgi:lantibiotic modifying enzyme
MKTLPTIIFEKSFVQDSKLFEGLKGFGFGFVPFPGIIGLLMSLHTLYQLKKSPKLLEIANKIIKQVEIQNGPYLGVSFC